MSRTTAAVIAAALLTGVAAYQVALALGAPWGDAVLGGRAATDDGVLTGGYRVVAGLQAPVLLAMAAVLLARGGVRWSSWGAGRLAGGLTWVIAGLMIVNTLGNLSSDHWFERWVLGVTTVLVALVALRLARQPDAGSTARLAAGPWTRQ
jgi:hypothetical protein